MIKSELESTLRTYVSKNLTPTEEETARVDLIYSEVQVALGRDACRKSGSFSRFTAITPVHDLDVIYIAGEIADFEDDPLGLLQTLAVALDDHFSKTDIKYKLEPLQTHSVSLSFPDLVFSIDVVPAYVWGINDYDDPIFYAPEIINAGRKNRTKLYEQKTHNNESVGWVLTDPIGYRSVSRNLNKINRDYRKAVKLVKKWKHHSVSIDGSFGLKSFHLEQIVVHYFLQNSRISIFDAIFDFFTNLEIWIEKPQIPDRADQSVMIDAYIEKFTESDVQKILSARDTFMVYLEDIDVDAEELFQFNSFYYRASSESFLFDQKIPTFVNNDLRLKADGLVSGGGSTYSEYWLSEKNFHVKGIGNNINFRVTEDSVDPDLFKWKVKNDHIEEPRGEITDHQTLRLPEKSAYTGKHYVECYAIKDNRCIQKHRVSVNIDARK